LSAPLDDPLGLGADPIAAFRRWFAHAAAVGPAMPEAMTLATAAPDGAPSLRWVLFKTVDDAGAFSFFTSYESRKAGELTANPHAALAFWWPALERQVRVEGTVGRVPAAASDAYWASRHPDSRIAAATSPQSGRGADGSALCGADAPHRRPAQLPELRARVQYLFDARGRGAGMHQMRWQSAAVPAAR
jgi:pyridoxamine-phosphate oxidase